MQLVKLHDNGEVTIPTALRKCADKLEEVGVAKGYLEVGTFEGEELYGGYYTNRRGSMCSIGVINSVLGGFAYGSLTSKDNREPVIMALAKGLGLLDKPRPRSILVLSHACSGIVNWNNSKDQSADDIIEGFRKVADQLELTPTT